MASIIDSFRETFTDHLAFLKIFVFSIPVYFSYQGYLQSNGDLTKISNLLYVTLFLLFGFLIQTTNNVINERDMVLSTLNPLKVALSALKGIIAIGPCVAVSCFAANYLCSLIKVNPGFDVILDILIWFVAASVITTCFLMFTTRENILDSYNLKILFQKGGDLIVSLIVFIIQIVVINIPTTVFISYALLILFGFGNIFNVFVSLAFVFNVGVIGHYFGQLHYENISYNKLDKKE